MGKDGEIKEGSKNDSPKGEDKLKFSQEQYEMLKRCSDKKNMTEWNEWRENNPEEPILLEGANLSKCYLNGVFLATDVISGVHKEVHLEGAKFISGDLKRANLSGAKLKDAKLYRAHLDGAELDGANLENADLRYTNLKGAYLARSNLQGAKLWHANLQGVRLSYANLQGADLREADLNKVNAYFAKFDSRIRCVSLKGKDFYGSPVFKRFVEDCDYLEDFKRRNPAIYWIWLISCNCGRSLFLWAIWSVLFALGYAIVFFILGPESMNVADLPWNFSTLVYYSVVTFTTLGFGDIVPTTNAAAWWVMAEVITGYVMLGGLISIFANKLARRS